MKGTADIGAIKEPVASSTPTARRDMDARREWERMRASARALERPVLVLDGWHSPGVTAWGLARRLCRLTSKRWEDFGWVTYPWAWSLEMAAEAARRVVRRRGWLGREVDIVGISMGGLVARMLAGAGWGEGAPAVLAVRIFTICTPHRGARLARVFAIDRAARDMRPGSDALRRLDAVLMGTCKEMVCYALAHDWLVGEENTAPPGMRAMCVEPSNIVARWLAHYASIYDLRVQVDIARRLRGEA